MTGAPVGACTAVACAISLYNYYNTRCR